MDSKQFELMLTLLEDPDKKVYEAVSKNLMDQGIDIVPKLEKAWEVMPHEKTQEKIETIIHNIQFESTKKSLRIWRDSEKKDLLEGAYYIARYQYPELSYEELDRKIEGIKKEVWLELNNNLTALEKCRIINHFMFQKHRYSRNLSNYHSPQNSYINIVIETKKGNPITLSIIYAAIAQRLELPVFGVNLPRNLILAYKDEFGILYENNDVLFYINPYNKGTVLSRKEIDYYLKHQKIDPLEIYYSPCSNIEVIIKLINELGASYEKLGYHDKASQLQEFITILQNVEDYTP